MRVLIPIHMHVCRYNLHMYKTRELRLNPRDPLPYAQTPMIFWSLWECILYQERLISYIFILLLRPPSQFLKNRLLCNLDRFFLGSTASVQSQSWPFIDNKTNKRAYIDQPTDVDSDLWQKLCPFWRQLATLPTNLSLQNNLIRI